ncbi:hypothetical protein QE152_g40046 [Popillia japonica]|uniref:Uncharacterized protein n=1 Tax=Popillia japonica TaxID=7064 RepID=A0AAW1HSE0_POPJA
MARRVREWRVLQTENLTDHAYIMFDISSKTGYTSKPSTGKEPENLTDHAYIMFDISSKTGYTSKPSTGKEPLLCDWNGFSEELTLRISVASRESQPYWWNEVIKEKRNRNNTHKVASRESQPYWWNEVIKEKRNQCTIARRILTRLSSNPNILENIKREAGDKYKAQKRELRQLIRKEKRKCWRELCLKLEDDIWGSGYKIAIRDLKYNAPYSITQNMKISIVEKLFITQKENPQ